MDARPANVAKLQKQKNIVFLVDYVPLYMRLK